MPKLTITPLARNDIKGIARYTQKKWGLGQRGHYLNTLEEAINHLVGTCRLDDDSRGIRPGLFSCRCQKHRIFFRRDDQGNVEILRILGQRMDFKIHL